MKVGVIGTGNMGTIIIEALITGGAVSPSDLIVTNRTKSKADRLKHIFKEITVAGSPDEVIKQSEIIFICVKPLDIISLSKEKASLFTKEKCVISITSPIQVPWLEQLVDASCMRIIPSITNRALAGVSLFTFGKRCEEHWKEMLWEMFSKVSVPLEIDESIIRVSSDIVSCGPAFISFLTRSMITAAEKETKIDETTATMLAENMLIGLGELLKQKHFTFPTLQEKVCVKGGITGEGIAVLEQERGEMFEKLFRATHKKFADEAFHINKKFNS
ncbi:late competence protein ComER [Siminovitchia acidinfaciens]|uniref:Late competence protein ComER n=2 Tax=Siminovitchia acidinfaciens TaxID=2321395 RepID=A0A429XYR7_9BACI|nr:late competence protein ComER [Siminovitchia acidinfaciens]